jgi:hypothetical protein
MANSLKVIKKNMLTSKSGKKGAASQAGLIIPFYARFAGKGSGTAGPPTNWLSRR